jgi:SAM-dependent methyltransferase
LAISPDESIADLGCGTGKLTRSLVETGALVVGIDPLPAMVGTFKDQLPGVTIVAGLAEAIPFADGSFDAVVCAAAFHWFRHEIALPEIHRVLRRGGRLGIVWNRRDDIGGWAAGFWEITEAYRRGTPTYRTGRWREALERTPLFGPIAENWFDHVQRTDTEGLLASSERRDVLDRARRFLETHPDTKGRDLFELPYRTAVYVTERVSET